MHVAGIGGGHSDVNAARNFYEDIGLDEDGLDKDAFYDFMRKISKKSGQSLEELSESFIKGLSAKYSSVEAGVTGEERDPIDPIDPVESLFAILDVDGDGTVSFLQLIWDLGMPTYFCRSLFACVVLQHRGMAS